MRNGRLHVTLTLPLTLPFLRKCNPRKSFAEVFHVCGRVSGMVGPAPPSAQEPVRAACQGRRGGCGALLAGPDRRHADRYQHRRAKRAARCTAAVRARSAPTPKGLAARLGAERADRPPQPAAFTGQHAGHLGGHGLFPAGNAARALRRAGTRAAHRGRRRAGGCPDLPARIAAFYATHAVHAAQPDRATVQGCMPPAHPGQGLQERLRARGPMHLP